MTIAQSILAVANKVAQILTEINTAITNKGGSSVNCLDDVASAIDGLLGTPKNSITITDTYGDRTIYFDGYESGGEKYDFAGSAGIKADAVKALNYGDVTSVYAIYSNSAHALESIYFPCFVSMGGSAESIYSNTADSLITVEVGSAAYPQNYTDFAPILNILYNNTDVETITVYVDTTDSDYETLVEELEEIAEGMTNCTLTIYDVTNGEATVHEG